MFNRELPLDGHYRTQEGAVIIRPSLAVKSDNTLTVAE